MALDLAVVCVPLLCLLGCTLFGWWLAEVRVRELERDLDDALGWEERSGDVVRPVLHLLERESDA